MSSESILFPGGRRSRSLPDEVLEVVLPLSRPTTWGIRPPADLPSLKEAGGVSLLESDGESAVPSAEKSRRTPLPEEGELR